MRDLLSDLNNYAYASYTVNDVCASSGISSPLQAVSFMPKRYLRWKFM